MTKQIRLIRSCARLIVWAIAMASIVCVNGHLRALCLLLDTLIENQGFQCTIADHVSV